MEQRAGLPSAKPLYGPLQGKSLALRTCRLAGSYRSQTHHYGRWGKYQWMVSSSKRRSPENNPKTACPGLSTARQAGKRRGFVTGPVMTPDRLCNGQNQLHSTPPIAHPQTRLRLRLPRNLTHRALARPPLARMKGNWPIAPCAMTVTPKGIACDAGKMAALTHTCFHPP